MVFNFFLLIWTCFTGGFLNYWINYTHQELTNKNAMISNDYHNSSHFCYIFRIILHRIYWTLFFLKRLNQNIFQISIFVKIRHFLYCNVPGRFYFSEYGSIYLYYIHKLRHAKVILPDLIYFVVQGELIQLK